MTDKPEQETLKELVEFANTLPHEQSENPADGMVPTESCAHCQLLLVIAPLLSRKIAEARLATLKELLAIYDAGGTSHMVYAQLRREIAADLERKIQP